MTDDARLATLSRDFAGIAGLDFHAGPGGLVFARIANAHARAALCLQGAQLTHWQPLAQTQPVLWLSEAARYEPGKAIRGGIPVCWPWFGAPPAGIGPAGAGGPAHGFARTLPWDLSDARTLAQGATQVTLQLRDSAASRALWPAPFLLELRVTVGELLELALTTHNTGAAPLEITEALHAYFRIGDIGAVAVQGLAGADYFDAAPAPDGPQSDPAGELRFAREVDRIYASSADCWIEDPLLQRRLHIAKQGSASTVVWNPWDAKAGRLGDLGPGQWRQMVCVESANARQHAVRLEPGARHCLTVRYRVEH